MGPRSVGVEEELLLVDPDDGRALAVASAVLHDATVHGEELAGDVLTSELARQQIETNTRPCTSLDELGFEVRRWRHAAAEAAQSSGAQVAALGTSPLPVVPSITPSPRYREMVERFGITAEQQLTCGCHIHVGVNSDEEAVAVLDRIRGWLPVLLALSANSPFWQGEDTGYASFRSQVWDRWPSAGSTELFGSAENYHATVRAMLDTDTVIDEGMIYFDARLSRSFPTVEVRVADVCLHPDDAVLLAGLTRALVETAARAWKAGQPPTPLRVELLRLAGWRASRSGLDGNLIDPAGRPAPAQRVARALLEHVTPALQDLGEYDVVQDFTDAVFGRGNGSKLQREVRRRGGSLADVVACAVTRSAG
ncbi:MAG: glutamate--cysteine ligase [Actinomycetota bacterium]|nr:glutamate--cysteine ligase [Actinomycetota bacterium]